MKNPKNALEMEMYCISCKKKILRTKSAALEKVDKTD